MALATLSIDIEARLAKLEQSLGKASRLAEKNAAAMERRYKAAADGISSAFKLIGGAIVVQQLAAFGKAQFDAVLAIKDLSEAAGSSISKISGLEEVSRAAGGSIAEAGDTLIKFNMALKDIDTNKQTQSVFKALGLDAAELKRLDPADALQKTAKALAGFADDGERARAVQILFGKSVKEAGPFLRELAEAGELNGKVTKEQVEQTDKFNKELAKLRGAAEDSARVVGGELASAINELLGALRGDGPGAINEWLTVPLQAVAVLGANVAFVIKGIGNELGGIAAKAAAVARLDFSGAGAIGRAMKEDAAAARVEFDRMERRLLQLGTAPQADYGNEGRNASRPTLKLPATDPSGKKGKQTFPYAITDPLADQRASFGRSEVESYAEVDKLLAEIAERAKGLGHAITDPLEDTKANFLAAEKAGYEGTNKYLKDLEDRAKNAGDVLTEFALQAQRNVQDALGDTLEDALGGNFDNIGKRWASLLQKMVAQALALKLNEALFGSGGPLAGLFGVFGASLGIGARAGGGPVTAGSPYLVGEKGPELIVPRSNGFVIPNGASGGQSVVVNIHQNIGQGVSRAEVYAAGMQAKEAAKAELMQALRRQRVLA